MVPLTELPEFLGNIPVDRSIERFGQIQKIIFQRKFNGTTLRNGFTIATSDPKLLASWTPLITASDDTKIVTSPFISEPSNEAGAARTYGGGNATLNGVEIVLGTSPSPFTAKVLESKQHVIKELAKLQDETLQVYLVNERGQIGMLTDGKTTPLRYLGIPIRSLFVGDKVFGNFEGVDSNDMNFVMEPNALRDFIMVTPTDFDALNDLDFVPAP